MVISDIITAEQRNQILADRSFEESLNAELAKYKVKFTPGETLSKMVKASPEYQKLDKSGQTEFFNQIKSLFKAHKVGEHLTVQAIARGFWARFNGTTLDKKGDRAGTVKQVNVSLMRGDVKASKLDGNLEAQERVHQLEQDNAAKAERNAKLEARLRELGIDPDAPQVDMEVVE